MHATRNKQRWTINDLGNALAAWGDEGQYHAPAKRDRGGSHVVILNKGRTVFKLFLCEMVDPISGSSEARVPPKKPRQSRPKKPTKRKV